MHHSDDYFAWVIMQSMANSIPGTNSLWKIAIEIGRMEKLGVVDLKAEMKQVEKQIDEALDAGDREEFMRLSERYKYLKTEAC